MSIDLESFIGQSKSEAPKVRKSILNTDKSDIDKYNEGKSYSYRYYADILKDVQVYMATTYQDILANSMTKTDKSLVKEYVNQYLITQNVRCRECADLNELVDKLYKDMAEFSFITDWLENADKLKLEEININSWDDIEVIADGEKYKADEKFNDPQHAVDVVRRMLQVSNTVIDDGNPTALGSLAKNIRISALKSPVLDDDIGVAASIRIVGSKALSKEKLEEGTATEKMLEFLSAALRYGISICIAGNTGSGKTSTAGWLLSTIPDYKRIYTIEEGSREFDLIRRNADGAVRNSVIHTITKSTVDGQNDVTQEDLLDFSLRFDPDIICVGEMRSREAFAAQEASRTGHTVITTIHAKTAAGAYMRMTTLAKRAYEFSDDTLMKLMVEAFPIIVYQRQLEDHSRKITEIIEGEDYRDGKVIYRTLFRYVVDENVVTNEGTSVVGHFEEPNGISERLKDEFLQNGAEKKIVDMFYTEKPMRRKTDAKPDILFV